MINCTGGPDKPLENLLLAAVSNGIDSLWMCDVLYAYQEYQDCLKLREPLVACVALSYRTPTQLPENFWKQRSTNGTDDTLTARHQRDQYANVYTPDIVVADNWHYDKPKNLFIA